MIVILCEVGGQPVERCRELAQRRHAGLAICGRRRDDWFDPNFRAFSKVGPGREQHGPVGNFSDTNHDRDRKRSSPKNKAASFCGFSE
jgi:hypothetical protein